MSERRKSKRDIAPQRVNHACEWGISMLLCLAPRRVGILSNDLIAWGGRSCHG